MIDFINDEILIFVSVQRAHTQLIYVIRVYGTVLQVYSVDCRVYGAVLQVYSVDCRVYGAVLQVYSVDCRV